MSPDEIHFYNIDREEIQKDMTEIKWDAESAEKDGYEHFMLKGDPRAAESRSGYRGSLCEGWERSILLKQDLTMRY